MSQGKWVFNGAPRQGGRFLWRQLYNARRYGAKIVYGAMWDEYDEGTNFIPVVSHKRQLPHDGEGRFRLMALDEDGYDLPSDWYMRIAGMAAEGFKGQREVVEDFPEKELRDWWGTRPKYELGQPSGSDVASGSGSGLGQGAGNGQTYEQWLVSVEQTKEGDELPPPPYSIEADSGTQSIPTGRPAPPLATRPAGPPALPRNSRPHAVDPVSVLADDLSRQSFSPPPIPPPRINPAGPPPVHLSSRPSSIAGPPPLPPSRPVHHDHSAGPSIPIPELPPTDGAWSRQQPIWPPPEWSGASQAPRPQSTYPHQQPYPDQSTYSFPGSASNMPGGFGAEIQFPQADISPAGSGYGFNPSFDAGRSGYGDSGLNYGYTQPHSPNHGTFPTPSPPPSMPPRELSHMSQVTTSFTPFWP